MYSVGIRSSPQRLASSAPVWRPPFKQSVTATEVGNRLHRSSESRVSSYWQESCTLVMINELLCQSQPVGRKNSQICVLGLMCQTAEQYSYSSFFICEPNLCPIHFSCPVFSGCSYQVLSQKCVTLQTLQIIFARVLSIPLNFTKPCTTCTCKHWFFRNITLSLSIQKSTITRKKSNCPPKSTQEIERSKPKISVLIFPFWVRRVPLYN